MSEELKNALQQHMDSDQRLFEDIGNKLDKITENHLFHMEKDAAATTANVEWLMKGFWLIATVSVGGLITGMINLFFK